MTHITKAQASAQEAVTVLHDLALDEIIWQRTPEAAPPQTCIDGGAPQVPMGEGCVQLILDVHQGCALDEEGESGHNAAQAVAEGHAILCVEGVASAEECALLDAEARAFASQSTRTNLNMASVGRVREPVIEMLQAAGQALCEELLKRALRRVGAAVPGLLERVFGEQTAQSFEEGVMSCKTIAFSQDEPALNVYSSNGKFLPHTDKEALTLLINLSSPMAYVGGGTGFYSAADTRKMKQKRGRDWPAPTVAIKGREGTTLVFAGNVLHCGVSVDAGTRCCLVASFSPSRESTFYLKYGYDAVQCM